MDLERFLKSIGAKVEPDLVRDVVKDTLQGSDVSPSELVDALAKKMNRNGPQVLADRADSAEAGAAGKVIAFLVESGDIRVEGRRVYPAGQFAKQ